MANIIKIKRKTTTGAPALGQLEIGEFCFVTPDNALYIKKDAGTIVGPFVVGSAAVWGAITGTLTGQADLVSYIGTAVSTAINNLIGGAPGALDTLNELAAALADDAAFSATVTAALATKLDANSTIDGGTIA